MTGWLCLQLAIAEGWAQTTPMDSAAEPAESGTLLPNNPLIDPLEQLAPPRVRALFEGDPRVQTAVVHLDGRSLFTIAALAEGEMLTATSRAAEIEQRLQQIAAQLVATSHPTRLAVNYEIDAESNQPIIQVNGAILMTVTFLDGQISGMDGLVLRASQLSKVIESALTRYYLERQPAFLWKQLRWALAMLLGTLLGSLALAHRCDQFRKKCQTLQSDVPPSTPTARDPAATNGMLDTALTPASVGSLYTRLRLRQKVKNFKILGQVLQFGQVVLWCSSGFAMLGLFPYTRWLQPFLLRVLRIPFRVFLILLIGYWLIRLADVWIDCLGVAIQTRAGMTLERSQRLALRLSTFTQVAKGILTVITGIVALLVILTQLGVDVGPLVAGAGLIGVAISFASQSLIKDLINGLLILIEDHYGVGDVITVRDVSGFVETMNLRITQLRDTAGQLITIPNGQIDIVQNLSKEWSRVDLLIPVGLAANIDQALRIVEQVAYEMTQDEAWGHLILEPPLLLGVDALDHSGATIRLWIKTQPLKQWDVAREYRRRLKGAFEAADIPIGLPHQIVHVAQESSPALFKTVSSSPEQNVSSTAAQRPVNESSEPPSASLPS